MTILIALVLGIITHTPDGRIIEWESPRDYLFSCTMPTSTREECSFYEIALGTFGPSEGLRC